MCGIEKEHVFGCLGIAFIATIFAIIIIDSITRLIDGYNKDNTTETYNKIDSITKENKTIIIEVEHLDSIKNEKVIKVKTLDNDSTLKLFYQLISE